MLLLILPVFSTRSIPAQSATTGHTQRVIVDGAVNPELISDYRAYSLLFRISSNRIGHERAIRAYLRQIFRDQTCAGCSDSVQIEKQIDNFIAAGEEFFRGAQPLDIRIAELLRQVPSPAVDTQLAHLRQEKEKICAQIGASLVVGLGPTGAEKLRQHVDGMKRKMKIVQ